MESTPIGRWFSVLACSLLISTGGATTGIADEFPAHLKKSDPPAGDTLAAPPKAIRLWFSEKPEIAVSSIVLIDTVGNELRVGKPRLDTADETEIIADVVAPMTPGAYRIDWRTMGQDGHPTHGSVPFILRSSRNRASTRSPSLSAR